MNDNIDENMISPDDRLEESRNNNTESVGNDPLTEDNDTPLKSSQDPGVSGMPVDHPITDVGLDEHELYDQGEPDIKAEDQNKV